jgi:AhpD family alkylhydroperoxidase
MTPRIDFQKTNPKPTQLLLAIEGYLKECGLDHGLLHLIKMRASQINGCAYCLDMHSKDARAAGESEQRLYALNAWNRLCISLRAVPGTYQPPARKAG